MKPERHQRAMDVFLQACEIDGDQRAAFLERACADDPRLRQEVESLLQHHTAATISTKAGLRTTQTTQVDVRRRATPSFLSTVKLRRGLPKWRPILAGLPLLVLLGVLWNWTETGVRRQLTRSLEDRLQMTLQANLAALDQWFAEEKVDVDSWAENDSLRQQIGELAQISRNSDSPEQLPTELLNSDAYRRLCEILEPAQDHPGELGVVVVGRDGIRLMHQDPTKVGVELETDQVEILRRVMGGETVLVRPAHQTSSAVGYKSDDEGPATAIAAPVRNEKKDVIAALAFAFSADREFTTILSTAGLGETGETYAFDKEAVLLSRLRDEETVRRLGLLGSEQSSPLNIQIRDPGGDLATGYVPPLPRAEQPPTRMVTSAAAGQGQQDLNGYRNYRGLEVIGAWKWLPQYSFGVATEMSRAEAYAPLAYVTTSFRCLFAAVTLLTVAMFLSSLSIAHLRGQVRSVQQLGPYTLQNLLGKGGMGKVYRARHALLRRPTAVKLLEGEQADPESVRRFEREVQLTSQLTHPNTIQIYDFGRSPEGMFYYAMEYLDGPTLEQLLSMDPQVPVARTIHILRQVCGSLREAHQRGLVHRDIKPQNIMLCCRGGMYDSVKVLDFGLVKNFASPGDRLTRPATLSGTPAYIAPERVDHPDTLDGRSDLYSLGAVAFYLLTGRDVFRGKSAVDVIVQAMQKEPPRPTARATIEIPPELDDLVVHCLAKEPSRRPATVDEVIQILDQLAGSWPWPQTRAQSWWEERWTANRPVAEGTDSSDDTTLAAPHP